jgi:hypothetical protein
MKKLLSLIIALVLLPIAALADLPDVAGMTDQELKDLISACSQELRFRNTSEPEGILLFEMDGFKVFQTGAAKISGGFMRIPVTLYNENDFGVSISPYGANCNGWDIWSACGDVSANAKSKETLTFSVEEAEVTEIDQIESLKFVWKVYNTNTFDNIYNQKEPEEHRFW